MYASILHSTLKSQVRRCISYHFLAVLAVTGLRLGNRTARLQQKKQKQNNTVHICHKCDLYVAQTAYMARA